MTKQLEPYHFKKGVSGNPSGRPKKSLEVEKKRLISYVEFVDLLQRFSEMTAAEIKAYLGRPEANMFELIYGKLMVQAANGDKNAREMVTERLFGKVKILQETRNLNMNVDGNNPNNDAPPVFVVEMTENGKFEQQRPRLLKPVTDGKAK